MSVLPAGALAVEVASETVVLLPERALWIPAHDAVVVADLHWGKAATFRASRVPVPMGTTASDLTRLSRVLSDTGASQLIILGDLLHARAGRHEETFATIAAWRARHASLQVTLVRGNHDRHAGDPPASLDIDCQDDPWRAGPFVGVHEPALPESGYVLAGHLHPNVTVHGRGRSHVRLPAFVFGATIGILPAFSAFTGGGMYARQAGDALYGIAGGEVIALR
ncbi:MAG TPA: ligase-associated DNA damage response endonuclease PdeM [Gemmatimonas sp.]|uniref:ligase-associated DNA damage response endonuclease PdeM n=1 Tax=Gemmatimonas sp. TaxID=1962908 RepID=UPI002EDAD2B9